MCRTETNVEDLSGENVQDMEEDNISKYRSDPTMEGGFIVVEVYVCLLSNLSLNSLNHQNISLL
jgi:hypothetical protein